MPDATIKPLLDGPLEVKGISECRNSRGDSIAVRETFYLCRCGGSDKKPFCDGTHKKNGFSDRRTRTGQHESTRDYAGAGIVIHDNRSVCAHIGHCTNHSPEVFRLRQEPWINPDGDAPERIAKTIDMCPSGALAYTIGQASRRGEAGVACVHVLKDGPYFVDGGAVLECDLEPLSRHRYTLCRCGASKNKPYCDGSHWNAGFKDDKT
jgi:CDGSH-type Zn-finger protein/ferredoxin